MSVAADKPARTQPADVYAVAVAADPADLLTVLQAAALMGGPSGYVTEDVIRGLIARGVLPAYRIGPKTLRVRKQAVLDYLESTRTDRE